MTSLIKIATLALALAAGAAGSAQADPLLADLAAKGQIVTTAGIGGGNH
ncbi:MAG: hypothetical protein AB7E80_17385 [Hyphomicrobiaceae bacterium]